MLPGRLESALCHNIDMSLIDSVCYTLVLCDSIKNDVKRLGNAMENYASENWLGKFYRIPLSAILSP